MSDGKQQNVSTFGVVLAKPYPVRLKANGAQQAAKYPDSFTGGVQGVSSMGDGKWFASKIAGVDCGFNEIFETHKKLCARLKA